MSVRLNPLKGDMSAQYRRCRWGLKNKKSSNYTARVFFYPLAPIRREGDISKMEVTPNFCCFYLCLFFEYRRTQGVNKCRADERRNAAKVAVSAGRNLAVGHEQNQ